MWAGYHDDFGEPILVVVEVGAVANAPAIPQCLSASVLSSVTPGRPRSSRTAATQR
jgi:hypothetical protein